MVVRLAVIHDYIGTSADTKPTVEVPAGSRFRESDAGTVYTYNGRQWIVDPGVTAAMIRVLIETQRELASDMRQLKLAAELIIDSF